MHALITGRNGTLGQALAHYLQAQGHHVSGWDRPRIHPLDFNAQAAYLDQLQPQILFHLAIASQGTGADNEGWRINVEWSEHLARLCAERGITLVFTSTAMVYNNDAIGPFTIDTPANAHEGYGFEKRIAEQRVFAANANARIVRLGWQIGSKPEGNNMLAYVAQAMRDHGHLGASTRWLPACSFLEDTAAALNQAANMAPGLYMANSNRDHHFYEILLALRQQLGLDWNIQPNEDYVYDQRLLDPRLSLPDLRERLPSLRAL